MSDYSRAGKLGVVDTNDFQNFLCGLFVFHFGGFGWHLSDPGLN